MAFLAGSGLWAGGRADRINTQTAEGRDVWQQEFDLSELKPGKYNVLISAKDAAGNRAESGPFNILVDPNAGLPVARVVYPENNQILRQDIKVIGVASGRFGVNQVQVRLDDREYSPVEGTEYWTRLVELESLAEGRHTLFSQAYDSKGTAGPEFSVTFTIDKAPPGVELISHRTGDVISGNITLTGKADDPNGIAAISYSADGETWTPLAFKKRKGETAVNFAIPLRTKNLEDGPAVYYIRSADNTGAEITRPYLFFVDNNGPELEILSPGKDEDVYGRVQVSGRIYDRVGLDKFSYEWAGETVDIPLRPGDPFWTVSFDVSAGQSRGAPLRVSAVDKSGNVTVVTQRLQDNRRLKTPSLVIDYPDAAGLGALPANGAIYGHIENGFFPASVVMEGAVEYLDARSAFRISPDLIAPGRSTIKLWALSEDEILGAPVNIRVNKPGTPPAPLADGTIPQTDLTPSPITITSPAQYAWVPNTFTLEGRAGGGSGRLEYRLSPADAWKPLALGSDGAFSANIGLTDVADGPVHLELRTIRGGVENFPYYHPLNKYSGGPEIGFLSPTPDLGAIHGDVTVTGTVQYPVPLTELAYSLDGETYVPLPFIPKYDRALFTLTCDFTALNRNGGRLTVRATDKSGVVVERTHQAAFDASTDMPTLILNTPADQQVITSGFEISGVAFDDDGVSAVYWRILQPRGEGDAEDGPEPEFSKISTSQSFQAAIPFTSVIDGENIIEVYAEDVFGVAGETVSRTIRVSTAPPVTVVEFPLLDAYNRREITVRGTSSDANGIEEILISLDNGSSYQQASGQEEWTLNLNTASYADGVYSVLLRTTDTYGIEAFSNALINIDNTPPEISLGIPRDGDLAGMMLDVSGIAVSGLDVSGQAHDDVGMESLTVQIISVEDVSRQLNYAINPGFVIQESLDVSRLPAGAYNLKITAVDYAGNENTVTRNVTIALDASGSELALVNPMPGEDHCGPLIISGKVSGAVIPDQVTLMVDGQRLTFIPVDRYGVFRYDFPEEQLAGRERIMVSANFFTPAGERITSADHEVRINRWGPTLVVDSHRDGDVITQRPWISGRAWVALTEEEDTVLTKNEKKELAVKDVFLSFDNGRSFERASGREFWKFRLETGDLNAGPLPILIKADFVDGRTAVRRIILTVDTTLPQVTTIDPVENSTHRDTILVYGAAADDYEIDSVEVSLRPGDKSGYGVPQFIQGLYFDGTLLGATKGDMGVGLSFFENNVKLQVQYGVAPPGRFTGHVVGAKLLANIFYLPFDYFLGPDWTFFSMSLAMGANFSFFTGDEEVKSMVMAAFLGQVEYARFDFSKLLPSWKYFKSFSLYVEPIFWFASSDVQAGAIFRIAFGTRISL
jgi:hypothetical protein